MGLTITPAVGGRRTFLTGVVAFIGGSFAGALAVISAAAVGFWLVRGAFGGDAVLALVGAVILLGVTRDCGLRTPVPYRSRQVPEGWRCRMSLPRVAAAYGALLGMGFFTRYTTSAQLSLYAILAASFSAGRIGAALLAYVIGKAVVLSANARSQTMAEVVRSMERALRAPHQRLVRAVAIACSLALAAFFASGGGRFS